MSSELIFSLKGPSFVAGAEITQFTNSLRELKRAYNAATTALDGNSTELYVVRAQEGSLITTLIPTIIEAAQHTIKLLPHISPEKLLEIWYQLSIGETPKIDKNLLSTIEALREAYGISKCLRKIFSILKKKGDVLEVSRGEEPVFRGDQDTASKIILPPSISEKEGDLHHVNLAIKQPDLTGAEKWKFVYQGRIIPASLVETEFRSRVAKGKEQFVAGDVIECDLEVRQVKKGKNTKFQYRITRVHKKYRGTLPDETLL